LIVINPTDSFDKVLGDIGKHGSLELDSIKRLSKLFPVTQISKVKGIMNEIVKIVFKPSNRVVWMKLGADKDYIIYPKLYCSCMDFFLQGISKNRKYYCKHLIAQGIVEALSSQEVIKEDLDDSFKERITQQLIFEHFPNM
jgi:predicted nucleic acid-binding Zn finger protein